MFYLINDKNRNILINAHKLLAIETMTGSDELTVKFSFEQDKFIKFSYPIHDCINVDAIISNIENTYQNFHSLNCFISVIDQQNVNNFENDEHQHLLEKNSKILVKLSSIQMIVDNNENDEVFLYTDDKTYVIGESVFDMDFKIKEKFLNIPSSSNKKLSFNHRL